ncbi:MAG: 16S rRNA (uracil(1498)-N(3))-methyltransferase [Sphingomonadales bacterium]
MSQNPNIRLFVKNPLSRGAQVTLNRDDSHYLLNVMRKSEGDEVSLFNGVDGEWAARISGGSKKSLGLKVLEQLKLQPQDPDLWLAFAPIKRARIDFIAQKATELGVSRLIPVRTERTVVKRVKVERLWANAKEAAEQCERQTVPDVDEMTSLKSLLKTWQRGRKLLFCDEDKTGALITEALRGADQKPARFPWGILIGPEGGFSDIERQMIRAHVACVPASLGPRVLRADTAMLSALSLWQATLGDW